MRLIDADALMRYVFDKWLQNDVSNRDWITFREWLNLQEIVEMPQKTGEWISEVLGSTSGYGTTVMYQCTNCEKMSISKYKFCPNCGARMEVEE